MQKISLTLLAAFAVLDQGSVHAQTAPASLCQAQEQVIFSCSVKPSKKLVSLCARQLGSPAASLQYRFGRPGHIELQHPQQGAGSLQAFRHASYGRYRVERQSVSFENQGVRYTVFDDYEGDIKPEVHERGVWVSQGERELATLRCTGPVRSELHRLREHLACDDTQALGCPAKP